MRIVYFANKRVGLEVLRFLKSQGEDIVALVVHPLAQQEHGAEIIAESGVSEERIFLAPQLNDSRTIETIARLRPDIGFSALFGYILKGPLLSLFPRGVLNVHPGYLPYNRGRNAHAWPIIDGTPAGAALHFMDAGVDTGPVVNRKRVVVDATDTGGSLYSKIEQACLDVVREAWPTIASDLHEPLPQSLSESTAHRFKDLDDIARIDPDRTYRAGELLDLLRALTFPGRPGAYFETDVGRVYLSLELHREPGSGK